MPVPRRSTRISTLLAVLSLATAATACERPTVTAGTPVPAPSATPEMGMSHGSMRQEPPISERVLKELNEVKKATSRFQNFEVAKAEGYSTEITGCWENQPVGAMGFHYGNVALIDGRVQGNRPEVLLYERARNGRMELVGVEWIIPFDQWHSDKPPIAMGREMMRNLTFNVWALHAWIWKHNPAGVFADWNPNVKCWPE